MSVKYLFGGLALIFIATTAFFAASYLRLEKEQEALSAELAALKTSTTDRITDLQNRLEEKATELSKTKEDNETLSKALKREEERNEDFEDQIEDLAGTVGVLDKLSKTDSELLQKYSRVYFLNEHYRPSDLDKIDDKYVADTSDDEFLHGKVMPDFERMVDAAEDDGIELKVVSAFRSFDEQRELKGQYLVQYGSDSNTFSADQGYSEHQLGTTVDFTTEGLGGGLDGFGNTPAYEWLQENAHKYGFVLSYSKDNQYYTFEPWHWRFVGEKLADDLDDDDAHFYDWDQRDIDEYLVSIFD